MSTPDSTSTSPGDEGSDRRYDVTIVIPAYNEENAIEAEIKHINDVMKASKYSYQLIIVDDHSADGTFEIASKCECKVIRQPRNMGYGAALKRGFKAARSDLVIITDADGTYPAEEMPGMLDIAGDYDMVVGSRTGEDVHIPLIRRPAKWFLRMLASYLAEFKIPDLNSGLRVIRRAHVRRFAHILPSGFSFTTTITLSLLCNEMTVGYVPINYKKRIGASKIRATDAYRFLMLILRVTVLFNPLRVFLPMGLFLFMTGFGKMGFDLYQSMGSPNISDGSVMGILGATFIWGMGLLADQNSKLGLDRDQWPD